MANNRQQKKVPDTITQNTNVKNQGSIDSKSNKTKLIDTLDNNNTYPCRINGIESHNLSDDALLYVSEHEKGFTLNNTAKEIWKLCDGKNSVEDIIHNLNNRFECTESILREDVKKTIEQLYAESLLELKNNLATKAD